MPKLAVVAAQLAEASLVVRTLLLFFGLTGLLLLWVPINTLGLLLVTVAVLFEELTDRYILLIIHVLILALVFLLALIAQPVHAHLLLQLVFVRLVGDRLVILFQVAKTGMLRVGGGLLHHARLRLAEMTITCCFLY